MVTMDARGIGTDASMAVHISGTVSAATLTQGLVKKMATDRGTWFRRCSELADQGF